MSATDNRPHWPGFESYYRDFYERCSEDEQRTLQVISLADLPLPSSNLERILTALEWQSSEGEPLVARFKKMLPQWRRKWVEQEWATDENERLRCSRFLVDLLSRQLVLDGNMEVVAEAVNRQVSSGFWVAGIDPEMRPLRFAFYRGDYEYLREWLGLDAENPWAGQLTADREEVVTNFCYFPVQPQWLERLPEWLHYHALMNPIRTDLLEVEGTPLLWEFWEQQVEPVATERLEVAQLAATFRIYRGEPAQAEKLLEGRDDPRSVALLGWCAMVQRAYSKALPLLEQGSGADEVLALEGPGPLFLQMLYLQVGKFEQLQQVVKLAEQHEQRLDEEGITLMDWPFAPAVMMMREVARVLMGVDEASQCALLQRDRIHSAWDLLIQSIARYWVGESISEQQMTRLQQHAEQASEVGSGL